MFWLSDVQRLLGGDVWPRVPLAAGATRLGGDALLLVGLVLISRATRAGRDVGGRLDASIIATTLAVDPMLLLAAMALFASVIGRLAIVTNELRGSHEQIAAAEARDELTGLASRTKFTDHLDTVLRQPAERGAYDAILLVDLDDFKTVNGGPGHAAGDALLFELGMRLQTIVRPSDLIARMGGDEFAILIEGEPLHTAIMIAQRVIRSVHEPVSLGGNATVYANASISIVYAHKGTDVDDVLRDADTAMYLATSRGKGRWEVFEPGMRAQAEERLELRTELSKALRLNQLVVHHQPIVDVDSGRLQGLEALMRWDHPTRGRIDPGRFIGIAEETEMIIPIGRWVIEEACRQVQLWDPSDRGLEISVNLSPIQLRDPDLVAVVRTALMRTGLAPHRLLLELTESSRTKTRRSTCSPSCVRSACASRSTTSVPASPRCSTCGPSRSTSRSSTAASSRRAWSRAPACSPG
jgi:diguanylate cyclase (GGDEF)-like protein